MASEFRTQWNRQPDEMSQPRTNRSIKRDVIQVTRGYNRLYATGL